MDVHGLILLLSSFLCALLLVMLTELAEQRQAHQARLARRRPAPPVQARPAAPLGQLLWDVRGFFGRRGRA